MKLLATIATAACGLAAAFALTVAPTARAYDIGALPAPYVVSLQVDASNGDCPNFYVVTWYDQSVRLNFGTNSHGGDCNSHFQEQLDAFVDATINLPAPTTTTVPPVTTTDATTTTEQTVTAATTTTASVPTPTQTVTVTVTDPTVDARLTALEAQYAALAARVDAVAKANTASWDAFSASLASGATVADAALAARSAGMTAIYQLG